MRFKALGFEVLQVCSSTTQVLRVRVLGFENQGSVGVALFDGVRVDGGGVHNADPVDRL